MVTNTTFQWACASTLATLLCAACSAGPGADVSPSTVSTPSEPPAATFEASTDLRTPTGVASLEARTTPRPAATCITCAPPAPPPSPSPPKPPSRPNTSWCEKNGGLAGLTSANSFSLHVISLHHGDATGNTPINSDLESAASFFGPLMWDDDPDGVVAFPAAPAGCGLGSFLCGLGGSQDQGYNSFSSDRFVSLVNTARGLARAWSVRDAHGYPDTTYEQGNTSVAANANWVIESAVNGAYPSTLMGSEAKYYGVFALHHLPTGLQIVIIAATLENGNDALNAGEALWLLNNVAPATKNIYPTFIAADLNFDSDSNDPALTPVEYQLQLNTTWLSRGTMCDNDDSWPVFANATCPENDTGCELIHLLLVNGAASSHVVPRAIRIDPRTPVTPPAALPANAGWISLPGIQHPMLEVEFAIQ